MKSHHRQPGRAFVLLPTLGGCGSAVPGHRRVLAVVPVVVVPNGILGFTCVENKNHAFFCYMDHDTMKYWWVDGLVGGFIDFIP